MRKFIIRKSQAASTVITKEKITEFKPLASFKKLKAGGKIRTLQYQGSAINVQLCSVMDANKNIKAGKLMALFPALFKWQEAEIRKAKGGLFFEYEGRRRVDPKKDLKLSAIEIEVA